VAARGPLAAGGCASPKRTTQPACQRHSSAFAGQGGLRQQRAWRGEAAYWPLRAGRFERRPSVKPAARLEPLGGSHVAAHPVRRRHLCPLGAPSPAQTAATGRVWQHRHICRIVSVLAFCFLPAGRCRGSLEPEAGATESGRV
jgi:hypothetical protein